ncbi:MAG: tRNA dihydrouridine(20/20a) synthase DusA [Spirochaeta sp. LUC14_002_19_P3]|nr:MAG: tRNA dihydrouridine(20/20a) synthase DusA [Spirochaeta sp. LUC14_002_19_P3]
MAYTELSSRSFHASPISLAPMVDKTDRDWRWIMRHITRCCLLYTEMITAPAVLRGNRSRLLGFSEREKPLALQLGWDEGALLAEACRIAEDYGYDEINLNCGCPSERVQRHEFGASLMANPSKTAKLLESMAKAVNLPVTVKHRIGIRSEKNHLSLESYEQLSRFVQIIADSGCRKFIVHARIADLDGLSPRENREIPPLQPGLVYRLKEDFPHLFIEINGGYRTPEAVDEALGRVDAVMIGRAALDNPWMLAEADRRWFKAVEPVPSRSDILAAALPYIIRRAEEGVPQGKLLAPIMNLFAGRPGARKWRRTLTELIASPSEDFTSGLENAIIHLDSWCHERH